MSPLTLVTVAAFATVLLIVLGLYWALVLRPESAQKSELRQRLASVPHTGRTKALRLDTLGDVDTPTVAERMLARVQIGSAIRRTIKQADLELSMPGFLGLSVGTAGVAYLAVWTLAGLHSLAIAVALVALLMPYGYIRHKRSQRLWQFEEQFPEAIDLIARALRAGHAFTTGLAMAGDELPPPVGAEFRLLFDRQNYGMALDQALKDFADRVPLLDARFFVTAVLMQRETGGNLAEVLDNLATVIRDRFQVKRQIRVVTAHGRITGWILAALPPVLALAMFLTSPTHLSLLISDPLGVQMVIGAVIMQITGTLVIRKLVDIPY